jgi:kanamycin kinase
VVALAAGRSLRPVWRNWLGGLTYEVVGAQQFIKWASHPDLDLSAEAARLRWAVDFVAVPRVVSVGRDSEEQWLVTMAVPGQSAVSRRWTMSPEIAVRAIGAGLRCLHDSLPVNQCPFSWSVATRLSGAEAGDRLLSDPPPVDRMVVCHGDACAPNTLIDDAGEFCGHVDCGAMGMADRWADLAIVTLNVASNYGPAWESVVLDAYGVAPDPIRVAYYRRLWDATQGWPIPES